MLRSKFCVVSDLLQYTCNTFYFSIRPRKKEKAETSVEHCSQSSSAVLQFNVFGNLFKSIERLDFAMCYGAPSCRTQNIPIRDRAAGKKKTKLSNM